MKKYAKFLIFSMLLSIVLVSCECKVCRKSGENDVKVCRDNYNSQDEYNQALGWYQLGEYSCNAL